MSILKKLLKWTRNRSKIEPCRTSYFTFKRSVLHVHVRVYCFTCILHVPGQIRQPHDYNYLTFFIFRKYEYKMTQIEVKK